MIYHTETGISIPTRYIFQMLRFNTLISSKLKYAYGMAFHETALRSEPYLLTNLIGS